MPKKMTYHYFPNQLGEEHKSFSIITTATDCHISITDEKAKKTLSFRFAQSGEFEDTHPKVMQALCNLQIAFDEETK